MTVRLPIARLISLSLFALTLAAPIAARADERDHCRNMIERDEHKLQYAIYNHGRESMEADISRQNLNEARQRCWDEFHVWWNGRDGQWHNVNDWEDYDRSHRMD